MGVTTGVTIGTVQSLVGRKHVPKAGLLVIDEAHHYVAAHWGKLRARDEYRTAKLLGLTATPQRADGTPLADMFDQLQVAAQYSELIELGCIVPAELWRPKFVLGKNLAQPPVNAHHTLALGQTLVFERSRRWVYMTTAAFNSAGIPACGLTDQTPAYVRRQAIAAFRAGTIKVLINHELLTEGVDLVSAETIIMARRYRHVSQYVQAAGRGLRLDPNNPRKKLCRVVDLTGMSYRFNFPDADREYNLFGSGMSEERGPLPYTPAAPGELNVPLILASRDDTPSARAMVRDTFWAAQMELVAAQTVSLGDARISYLRQFGEARAASDAADAWRHDGKDHD
jgi:superfamily II DNA or RNA helicase